MAARPVLLTWIERILIPHSIPWRNIQVIKLVIWSFGDKGVSTIRSVGAASLEQPPAVSPFYLFYRIAAQQHLFDTFTDFYFSFRMHTDYLFMYLSPTVHFVMPQQPPRPTRHEVTRLWTRHTVYNLSLVSSCPHGSQLRLGACRHENGRGNNHHFGPGRTWAAQTYPEISHTLCFPLTNMRSRRTPLEFGHVSTFLVRNTHVRLMLNKRRRSTTTLWRSGSTKWALCAVYEQPMFVSVLPKPAQFTRIHPPNSITSLLVLVWNTGVTT